MEYNPHMPQFLEDKLKKEAAAKGFGSKRAARYTYGAMQNQGLMKGNKITPKGVAVEKKHVRDTAPHVDRGHTNVRNSGTHTMKLKHS